MSTKISLSNNSKVALEFLQSRPGGHFGDEIAVATEINKVGIHSVLNSLVVNGLVEKSKAKREVITEDKKTGKKTTAIREQTVYSLTDAGREFIIK